MNTRTRRSLGWAMTGTLAVFIFVQGYLFVQTRNAQLAAEEEKNAQYHRVKLLLYSSPDPRIMCN